MLNEHKAESAISPNKHPQKNHKPLLYAALSIWALQFQIAHAACTTTGNNIVCDGTHTGTTPIQNQQNITYTNNGSWSTQQATTGATITNGNISGLKLINNGDMTWLDARNNSSGQHFGVLDAYGATVTASNLEAINNGNMHIEYTHSSMANGSGIGGMLLYSNNNQSIGSITNEGSINISASGTAAGTPLYFGIVYTAEFHATNNGKAHATITGATNVTGFSLISARASTATHSTFNNTGEILINSTGSAGRNYGVHVYLYAPADGSTSSATFNNHGTININSTTPGGHNGILTDIFDTKGIININNLGEILMVGSGNSISISGPNVSDLSEANIYNSGTIKGSIWLGNTKDHFTLADGSITGSIFFNAGNDTFIFSGGRLDGTVYLGSGNDTMTISTPLTNSNIPRIDGESGMDTLNIINTSLRGYSYSHPAAGNSNEPHNINLANLETINLNNSAELVLTANLFNSLNNGTLNINNNSSLKINHDATSSQTPSIFGNVTNTQNSHIHLKNTLLQDILTIKGDYHADNSSIIMETELNSDNSLTDKIIIEGRATGSTMVQIKNLNGQGDLTQNGIHIIQTGSSESNNTFYLPNNYVSAGVYDYSLNLHPNNSEKNPTNFDNWHLESVLKNNNTDPNTPLHTPNAGSYITSHHIGNDIFTMRLEDREGASHYQQSNNYQNAVWLRAHSKHSEFSSLSKQIRSKGNSTVFQVGVGLTDFNPKRQYSLGLMGGFGTYDGQNRSVHSNRKSHEHIRGYHYGIYGTWYNNPENKRGAYIDSWLTWSHFDNQIKSADGNKIKFKSSGLTASIEAGTNYLAHQENNRSWWIQPQIQVTYQDVKAEHFHDDQGVKIKPGPANWQGRIGVKNYLEITQTDSSITNYRPYVALNAIYNTHPASISVNNEKHSISSGKTLGEIKLGLEGRISENTDVWINISQTFGRDSYRSHQGNIGIKYNF